MVRPEPARPAPPPRDGITSRRARGGMRGDVSGSGLPVRADRTRSISTSLIAMRRAVLAKRPAFDQFELGSAAATASDK
jgi:hypothetical protein